MLDGSSIDRDTEIWSNAFRLLSGPSKTFLELDFSLSLHFFLSFASSATPFLPSNAYLHLYCLLYR